MKRHIALMATALLLCGGSYAQNTQPEKKPKAYVVADAHLDTQWNWDVQTTIKHHVWNTISQNLLLLKQYPDYIFNFEGGVKYAWMKEYYPAQYEEMKKSEKGAGTSVVPVGMPTMFLYHLRNQLSVTLCSDRNITGKNSVLKVPTFFYRTVSVSAGRYRPLPPIVD